MSLSPLKEAAKQFLECEDEGQALIHLSTYTELFDTFEVALSAMTGGTSARYSKEELGDLAALHQRVIDKSALLKSEVAVQLRELKKRGKGILAYTLTPEEQLALRSAKKGRL